VDLKGIDCEDVDRIHMTQDMDQLWTILTVVMNLWDP